MRYAFFDRDGVEYVRILVGADAVERPATDEDHKTAETENAAEDAAQAALGVALKERQAREAENEARALGQEPAPYRADEPTQKELEKEFDAGLKDELDDKADRNGKHKGKHKGAE